MAKKSEQTEDKDIEKVEKALKNEKKPLKPKLKTKPYKLKVGLSVKGQWKNKGETINLTEKGYRFFRSKKIV